MSPICLPVTGNESSTYTSVLATTTGWGNTDPQLISQSPKLLEISMRVWSGEQCARAYRRLNIMIDGR